MCSHGLSTVSYALQFTMAWTSLAQKISKMLSYDLPSGILARRCPTYSYRLRKACGVGSITDSTEPGSSKSAGLSSTDEPCCVAEVCSHVPAEQIVNGSSVFWYLRRTHVSRIESAAL